MKRVVKAVALIAFTLGLGAAHASGHGRTYEVTITNITSGQTFTPIIAATHRRSIQFFEVGQPALDEIAELAESGDIGPLASTLDSVPNLVHATENTEGLLGPGQSATLTIQAPRRFNRLSFAAMLIPTNDTFVAINSTRLPRHSKVVYARAYDAGSEVNDELCANIPGPRCEGQGASAEDGEGFVHISDGMHGIGDLGPDVYDWRNPVARVEIRRVY